MTMAKRIFWDTETTGLTPGRNGLISISGIIEIDNASAPMTVVPFDIKMNPEDYEIDQEALDTNGYTLDDLKTFQSENDAYVKFVNLLDTYVDKFDKEDKFVSVTFNGKFDFGFLDALFKKYGNNYMRSYFGKHDVDMFKVSQWANVACGWCLPQLRLTELSKSLGLPQADHTSLNDAITTRHLYYLFLEKVGDISWTLIKD